MTRQACPKCHQKLLQSIAKRCMYCGADLPEELHPSDAQRQAVLDRTLEANKAHDIAMEAKQAAADKKKKKRKPEPPTINYP